MIFNFFITIVSLFLIAYLATGISVNLKQIEKLNYEFKMITECEKEGTC